MVASRFVSPSRLDSDDQQLGDQGREGVKHSGCCSWYRSMAAVAAAHSLTADVSVLGPWDVALGDVAAGTLRAGVLLERTKSAEAAIAATTTTAVPMVASNSHARCVRRGSVMDVLAMTLASVLTTPRDGWACISDVVRVRLAA
jgi:hypothetical protein